MAQSFDIFNVYGRDASSLPNLIDAFWEVLKDTPEKSITEAFKRWMKEKSAMPTPSDIYKLSLEVTKSLRPKIEPDERILKEGKAPIVQWYGKMWKSFTADDKSKLEEHLHGMELENRDEYIKYIRHHAGYPID